MTALSAAVVFVVAASTVAQVDGIDIPELDDVQVDAAAQPTGTTLAAICSAYTWSGARTATGVWPTWGVVATDPSVLPMGTRMHISGFDDQMFVAADRGSGIRGPLVDIYMPTYAAAISYGRRPCTIQVLR